MFNNKLKIYFINIFNSIFLKNNVKNTFTKIYEKNYWNSNESISGPGSELVQTKILTSKLPDLFKEKNIKSILDLPCGDFKWMQNVGLTGIKYIGGDIVEDLIKSNIKSYIERPNLKFKVLNLINDPLPECDLIIVRDCLVHLSYANIKNAIKSIKSSGCKYLLTTTFTNRFSNQDIVTGDWRPINLEKYPFNFPPPLLVINENNTEVNGIYNDKSMALWEINKI